MAKFLRAVVFGFCILGTVMVRASDAKAEATPTDKQVIRLWHESAPEAKGSASADIPTITAALPPKGHADGAVFIVCPGGGYGYLSPREGMPVARWLNSLGITGFVLKYRIGPKYHYPAETDDVQRAIRLVRFYAKSWNLDPDRIGIIGFSAGGHLASAAITHFDAGRTDATDLIDRVSSRPDLAILAYPVICMTGPYVHEGSRRNLLGDHPDPKLEEYLSSDLQVKTQTPPCFLVAASDDHTVPIENSLLFAMALKKHGVPFEMHIFERGHHGFALGRNDPILKTWPMIAARWLGRHGYTNEKIAQ